MRGKTTVSQSRTLFDEILGQQEKSQAEENILKGLVFTNQSSQNTQSLKNQGAIYYQKTLDYKDYKQSLKYNNKTIKKICFEQLKQTPVKLLRCLTKIDLSGLEELKIKDLNINDDMFQIFQDKGGLSIIFPKLKQFIIFGCSQLTSLFLHSCFVNLKVPQSIEILDLSHSQIDDFGIDHLSQFSWPQLNSMVFQWCSKFSDIKSIKDHHKNFPQLGYLDFRFTKIENQQIQDLINSSLVLTLKQVRVYGSKINTKSLSLSLNKMFDIPLNQVDSKQLKLFKNIPYEMVSSQNEISLQVILDAGEKILLNLKWLITSEQFIVNLSEGFGSNFLDRSFLNHIPVWVSQIKHSNLLNIEYNFDNMQFNDQAIISLADSIASQTSLRKLCIKLTKQKQISKNAYFYLFSKIPETPNITYLQLIFPQNDIVLDSKFLEYLLKQIQRMNYLSLFYLNLNQNLYLSEDDLKGFLFDLLLTHKYNHWLFSNYIIFDTQKIFQFSKKDLTKLYFEHLKYLNFNLDEFNFAFSNNEQKKLIQKLVKKKNILFQNIKQNLKDFETSGLNKVLRKHILKDIIKTIHGC